MPDVTSEDTRYLEQDALPLQEEFPLGSRVIFMGEHAYGVAAQVVEANEKALSVILAVRVLFRIFFTLADDLCLVFPF